MNLEQSLPTHRQVQGRSREYYTSCITSRHQILVVCCRDQREPETEAFLAVSVSVRNDLEAFDTGDDVFRRDAVLRNMAVGLFVLLTQGVLLATFLGHGGLAVELLQTHIPSVGDGFGLGM